MKWIGSPRFKYGTPPFLDHLNPSQISVISNLKSLVGTLDRNHGLRRRVTGASLHIENERRFIGDDLRFRHDYVNALVTHLMELISPFVRHLEVKPRAVNLALLASVPSAALVISLPGMIGNELITTAHLKALFQLSTLRHLTLGDLCLDMFQNEEGKGSPKANPV